MRQLGRHLNAYVDDALYVEVLDDWARRYAEYAEVGVNVVDDLEELVRSRPPTKFVVLSEPADVDVAAAPSAGALGRPTCTWCARRPRTSRSPSAT